MCNAGSELTDKFHFLGMLKPFFDFPALILGGFLLDNVTDHIGNDGNPLCVFIVVVEKLVAYSESSDCLSAAYDGNNHFTPDFGMSGRQSPSVEK
jgi:hypothetical protein